MALIEQSEAVTQLGKHFPALYSCVADAWLDYISYPIEKRVVHSSRSRASVVHDHMVDRAIKYAAQQNGVKVIEKSALYLCVFDESIAIRFKKFDDELRTRNQPSAQVDDFKNQLSLAGVSAAHNLEAGYILSPDAQSIAAVHIVCPSGTGVYWDLLLTSSAQTGVVQDLFATHVSKDEDTEGARIKRRTEAKIIRVAKNDD